MQYWVVALLAFGIFSGYAYGQEVKQLEVYTPSSTYYEGDVLILGGSVAKILTNDPPVTIQVFSPTDDVVDVAQIDISLDGSFAHTMIASGPQWSKTGEYRIVANYGGVSDNAEFQFIKTDKREEITSNYEVDAGNAGTFDVGYTIRGGSVDEVLIDTHGLAIVFSITAHDAGEITVNIPKEFVDAQDSNGNSIDFIVLADDVQVLHTESISDAVNRKITVPFSKDSTEIRVIGTHAIPEFGVATLIIFGAAISAIILTHLRMPGLKSVF